MISDLTPEQILAANIDAKPVDDEESHLSAQIQEAIKGYQFSMKLTAPQVKVLERYSEALGLTWKEYLREQITRQLLSTTSGIGSPVITAPSMARGSKITGPSCGGNS